jgi:hypothetical protein
MVESARRLVLRYDPGQFTFRHINNSANDGQLLDLAMQLNAFQECEVKEVLKVRVFRF